MWPSRPFRRRPSTCSVPHTALGGTPASGPALLWRQDPHRSSGQLGPRPCDAIRPSSCPFLSRPALVQLCDCFLHEALGANLPPRPHPNDIPHTLPLGAEVTDETPWDSALAGPHPVSLYFIATFVRICSVCYCFAFGSESHRLLPAGENLGHSLSWAPCSGGGD